jgi:hypothetical protein
MIETTYTIFLPDQRVQTTDAEQAERYARSGVRVTASTNRLT